MRRSVPDTVDALLEGRVSIPKSTAVRTDADHLLVSFDLIPSRYAEAFFGCFGRKVVSLPFLLFAVLLHYCRINDIVEKTETGNDRSKSGHDIGNLGALFVLFLKMLKFYVSKFVGHDKSQGFIIKKEANSFRKIDCVICGPCCGNIVFNRANSYVANSITKTKSVEILSYRPCFDEIRDFVVRILGSLGHLGRRAPSYG